MQSLGIIGLSDRVPSGSQGSRPSEPSAHRLVVRNGSHKPREVCTAAGAIGVMPPRVSDERVDEVSGKRQRFSSVSLPYLHGLSSGDFGPALSQFLGSGAGLSGPTITRLTTQWQDEAVAFTKRSLVEIDYVFVRVDGIHLRVRLAQDEVCLPVMIGVRAEHVGDSVEPAPLLPGLAEHGEVVHPRLRHQVAQGHAKITDDLDVLLAFCDCPAEHWVYPRTTKPIESTFATSGYGSGSPRGPTQGPPGSRWPSAIEPHGPGGVP